MELVNKIDEKELYAARSVADAEGNNIVDTYAQKTEIPDVSNLATKDEISDMATESWVNNQDFAHTSEIPSIDGLMSEDKLTIEGGKITKYDGTPFAGQGGEGESNIVVFNDSNLPTSTELDAAIAANKAICVIYDGRDYMFDRKTGTTYYFYGADAYSSYFYYISYNGSNWRSGQQVLAEQSWVNSQGFAKASDIPSVDGLMDESKLTIEDGKITEYDGTPFAGGGSGGKTYEGVAPIIVDNDNDTISADTIELEAREVDYQQITHDDSLVHVSNDAEYALGVNTRMFPCDETVLWEGFQSGLFTITLSEPVTNFEKLFIVGNWNDTSASQFADYIYTGPLNSNSQLQKGFFGCTDWGKKYWALRIFKDTNTISCIAAKECAWGSDNESNMTNFSIQKVIGIGRKGGV